MRTVWTIPTYAYRAAHFATFPVRLVERAICITCPAGGTVLDPFAGAGTTALAAARCGRNSVNIDAASKYTALAAQRLAAASTVTGGTYGHILSL